MIICMYIYTYVYAYLHRCAMHLSFRKKPA